MRYKKSYKLKKKFRKMIVVDVETTGVDFLKNSIVSIGALDFSKPENQFYEECRIWEGAEINEEALKINGFSREQIINPEKISLEETVKKFIDWAKNIEDKTFAGENPVFDYIFLRTSAQKYNLPWNFGRTEGTGRSVDLHSLCYSNYLKRKLIPPMKNGRTDLNTNKILQYVGLPEEPNPHNALTGAKMEAEAFSRLIYGRGLLKEFGKFQIPDYLK